RGTAHLMYADNAPDRAANAVLTFSDWYGFYSSWRYRDVDNYRLDGQDASVRASGLDVIDVAITKAIRRWIDVNIDVDNATNKQYYETQDFFESRISPTATFKATIDGSPTDPIILTDGMTIQIVDKRYSNS